MEVDFSKQIQELKESSLEKVIEPEELSNIIASILENKLDKHNEKHESKVSIQQLKNVYLKRFRFLQLYT